MDSKVCIYLGVVLLFCSYYNYVEAGNCINLYGGNLFHDIGDKLDGYSDTCPPTISFGAENDYCCYTAVLKPYCCQFSSFLVNMALIIIAIIVILSVLGWVVSCVC